MDIDKSSVVRSLAGRDAGRLFFVFQADAESVMLVDGKVRPVERPKRKKIKHIEFIAAPSCKTADKLKSGDKVTNSEIRKTLAEFSRETGEV